MSDIYKILDELNIKYVKHDHPAIFTCEDAEKQEINMNGGQTKNLFLRNKKPDKYYLVSVSPDKKVDLKSLKKELGESKLGFGSPECLMDKMGLTPGSVSLLGLINNKEKDIVVIIDKDLWKNDIICCHPNINTGTLEIKKEDLQKFFDWCGNEVRIMDL